MEIINGNLLDVTHGIIAHQVNCQRVMGSGLALQIKNKYPQHFKDYVETVPKLGDIVCTKINSKLEIAGLYGQNNYGTYACQTNYNELENALVKLNLYAESRELPVYIPYKLGCGLAGGDWNIVLDMVKNTIPKATIVKFEKA